MLDRLNRIKDSQKSQYFGLNIFNMFTFIGL